MHHCIPEGIILPGRPGQGRSCRCFLLFSYVTAKFWVVPHDGCSKLMRMLLIFSCDWYFASKKKTQKIGTTCGFRQVTAAKRPNGRRDLWIIFRPPTFHSLFFSFFQLKTCTQWTSIHYFLFPSFPCNYGRICHIRQPPIVLKALNLSLPTFADGYWGAGGMEWAAFMWRLMASM